MKKQSPKKVTAGYIERAALHYLGRFSSSEANLRSVLTRKIRRRNKALTPEDDAVTAEQSSWLDDVVAKCVRYGYVNDESYGKERAKSLLKKGKPPRTIKQDLLFKGIASDLVGEILLALSSAVGDNETGISADLYAAVSFIKRRRFGPFRREMTSDQISVKEQKELASMARAGFSFELSRKVLDMVEEEALAVLR